MIIGIAGKINVGKDTVAKLIQEIAPSFKNKKFASKLKQTASLLTGVPVEKFEDQKFKSKYIGDQWGMTYRELLQKLGTEGVRQGVHTNAWVNALFADYRKNSKWVITDVRFPNEAHAIVDRGGYLIRIERELNPIGSIHESETALDNWVAWDHVIHNDGSIEDLRHEVELFMEAMFPSLIVKQTKLFS